MAVAPDIHIDEARVEAFTFQAIADAAGAYVTVLTSIGSRVGLWRALAEGGPATSEELAARTGTAERYVREWAACMASAGYVDYDAAAKRFSLPFEHALVLAHEHAPTYLGGAAGLARGVLSAADGVEAAFRTGGGVPIAEYGDHFWAGLEQITGVAFDHLLVQEWVPAVDGLQEALERGIDVADVGCGTGRALIRLAEAFPQSRFHGYDVSEDAVARARRAVEEAGVVDRVDIRIADGSGGLPQQYDLVTTFDVVHDSADPLGLLRSIRGAVKPGGVYVCLDISSEPKLEDNVGPLATLKYGISVLHCMTTSLAKDGAGLGTCGVHEDRLRELSIEAGFSSVARIAETPFDCVYEVRP